MPTTSLAPARTLLAASALVIGLVAFTPAAHAADATATVTGNVATWGDRDPANDHDGDDTYGYADNYYGQQDIPGDLGGERITAVAASSLNSMALDSHGKVYVWGDLGRADNGWSTATPADLAGENVVAIDTSTSSMMALTDDGVVHTWGAQAAVGGPLVTPPVLSGKKVTAIAAAGADLALTDENGGKVYAWGPSYFGEANVPAAAQSDVVAIAGDRVSSLALKSDGSIVMWGSPYGTVPTPDPGRHFVDVAAGGDNHYAALDDAGKVYTWGYFTSAPPPSLSGKRVVSLDVGPSLLAATTDQGEIVVWGFDGYQYIHRAGCPNAVANDPSCTDTSANNQAFTPANVAARKAIQVAVGNSHVVAALQTPVESLSPPAIAGTAKVGEHLTASGGTWTPSDAEVSLQWRRDGVAIKGATSPDYLLTEDDDDATITVSAIGRSVGYLASDEATSGGVLVGAADFTVSGTPTIGGKVTVGSTLTAAPPVWTPTPTTIAYQWLRDGVAVDGATKPTHLLTAADLRARISVTVTATRDHYIDSGAGSTATAPVAPGPITAAKPLIRGTAKAGRKLTALPGATAPSGTTLTYQWLRNGKAIKGAVKSTYKVTRRDKGRRLSIRVVRTKPGYTTLARVSKAVKVRR